jgi:hypothetical protein
LGGAFIGSAEDGGLQYAIVFVADLILLLVGGDEFLCQFHGQFLFLDQFALEFAAV